MLDPAVLDRLRRIGGRDFLLEMIALFLENAPLRVRAAREGVEGADSQAVYRAAHSLKSTAGNLGARVLQRTAERVERRAAARDMEGLGELVEEMAARYDAVRERLELERRRRSGE